MKILEVERGENLELVRVLLEEYAAWLEAKGWIFEKEYRAFQG